MNSHEHEYKEKKKYINKKVLDLFIILNLGLDFVWEERHRSMKRFGLTIWSRVGQRRRMQIEGRKSVATIGG